MRVFPRIGLPKFRAQGRRLRRLRYHLTAARVAPAVELLLLGVVLMFFLTGRRAAYLDWLHPRADMIVVACVSASFVALHLFAAWYILPAVASPSVVLRVK